MLPPSRQRPRRSRADRPPRVWLHYAALSAQVSDLRKVLIASRDPNEIALTYGRTALNDIVTERLLDVLAHHNVRATFFLIGRYRPSAPGRSPAPSPRPAHLIGNHTMTHPWLVWQSTERIRQELHRCNSRPRRHPRHSHPVLSRAPRSTPPAVLSIARSLGLTPVQWNIIPGDWKPVGAEEIAARTVRALPETSSTTAPPTSPQTRTESARPTRFPQ